jgi:hypothetical protein
VPAEQGFWLDEEPPPTSTIKESTQPSEQCPMSWSQGRSGYLATEDTSWWSLRDTIRTARQSLQVQSSTSEELSL